jgi:hypothetical protein
MGSIFAKVVADGLDLSKLVADGLDPVETRGGRSRSSRSSSRTGSILSKLVADGLDLLEARRGRASILSKLVTDELDLLEARHGRLDLLEARRGRATSIGSFSLKLVADGFRFVSSPRAGSMFLQLVIKRAELVMDVFIARSSLKRVQFLLLRVIHYGSQTQQENLLGSRTGNRDRRSAFKTAGVDIRVSR